MTTVVKQKKNKKQIERKESDVNCVAKYQITLDSVEGSESR